MKAFKLTKDNVIKLFILIVISSAISLLYFSRLGAKDSAMLFLATASITAAIYLAFKDKKRSLLLFILSLPILVTARKAFYIDFIIFKITYETLYITVVFILSYKDILEWGKDLYRKNNKQIYFIIFVAIFVIFAINSSIFSLNIPRSLRYTFISVIVPVMFMLSVIVNFKKQELNLIFYALFIQISFSSLYGFFQLFSNGKSLSDRSVLTFGYHNVNIYAGLVILIIPFMMEMFFYGKRRFFERALIGIAILLNTVALYITFTRGALFAFLVSVPVIFISKRYKWVLYGVGVIGIVAAKPGFSYIVHRGTSTSLTSNESTIARIQSFFTSGKIIESLPFGAGAGNFAEFYKAFSIKGYLSMPEAFRQDILVASYNLEAAHNLWLQIAVELGIVCAVVFLALIINRLWASIKTFKCNRPAIGAILAYMVFSMLTGVEFEHKGVITITLVIWLIFGIIEINNRECIYDKKPN
jgi:O-antigen ligase